jgi:hypothetical protein
MRKKKFVLALSMLIVMLGVLIAPAGAGASIFGNSNNNLDLGRLIILSKLFDGDRGGIFGKGDGILSKGDGINLGNLIILSRLFNGGVFQDTVAVQPTQPVTVAPTAPAVPAPRNLPAEMSGRILLQTNENGEAWYVNPANNRRQFLGDPSSAFNTMSNLAVGISESDFGAVEGRARADLSGRFLIRSEGDGELYYINPATLEPNYIGSPTDALELMSSRGIGISSADLQRIPTN